MVRCFRQKFSGEQVHLRTPSEQCEVRTCSLALPPRRTQSNLLSSLSHPRSQTQTLRLFSLEYSETFWKACDTHVLSDRWEGTCGNTFRMKILVSQKGRTVRPPQIQRRTHSFKGFLIPALSQADLNWGLWFPRYPEGWVLCQWLRIKPSSWTWGIFPIKLLPKLIKKEIARLNKNMWTSFAYHIQYLTCEAV